MRKIVLTFGLISGAVLSAMMLVSTLFIDRIGFDKGEIVGYASMVAAFLMIFFGVKSYRDNVAGGSIGFVRALGVGALIMVVASVCYVATWEVVYYKLWPDFGDKYAAHMVDKARASGASEAEIAAQVKQAEQFKQMYKNPVVNVALTFLEPLPVGLVIALVTAGVLRRRRKTDTRAPVPA